MIDNESNYWVYQAEIERVVDGDTVDLTVDLGFRTYKQIRVRLEGVDTAEIYGTEKESDAYKKGMKQKEFVEAYLTGHDGEYPLRFLSLEESGKYGRWIGDISTPDTEYTLVEAIVREWPEASN